MNPNNDQRRPIAGTGVVKVKAATTNTVTDPADIGVELLARELLRGTWSPASCAAAAWQAGYEACERDYSQAWHQVWLSISSTLKQPTFMELQARRGEVAA